MNIETALAEAREVLQSAAAEVVRDPQTNSVRRLALHFSEALQAENMSRADAGAMVAALGRSALQDRIDRFREYHALSELGARRKTARTALEAATDEGFDAFRDLVEAQPTGAVFTAHPTFSMRPDGYAAFADALAGGDLNVSNDALQAPRGGIDLATEHAAAQEAILRAQDAVSALRGDALAIAAERFPDQWKALRPRIASIASWVGYDLDGRTDIHWSASIALRLREKASQLRRYALSLAGAPDLAARLSKAAAATEAEANAFSGDLLDPDTVVKAANLLTGANADRLVSLAPAVAELDALIAAEADAEKAKSLMLVRAEMETVGLGTALTHLRVNAAQVRSALSDELGVDDDPENFGRVALAKAADEARSTPEIPVNFGSLFLEQMTARRQFMLCKQIVKHIDADAPIRFLIAEIERPATIMGAIYLARRFGVANRVDISPLFETPEALERGGRFMEQLFDEPEYMLQVRERGRISIQLGYSDSGRFMGQVAAALSAERLQVLTARELKRRGVAGLPVLVFNTHGESMGRGAHPASFMERLNHTTTPWVMKKFEEAGAPFIRETSFQGGDGYLHFSTPETALSSMLHLAMNAWRQPRPETGDLYYADINYSWDVYRALKRWQEELFENEGYRVALSAFGPNLLYTTGSRKTKRQGGKVAGPRALRAIPNNAILQQLCIVANVCGGLGEAAGPEAERFQKHIAGSPRLRSAIDLAVRGRVLSSLNVLRAYASLFDPSFWLALAVWSKDEAAGEAGRALSRALSEQSGADVALGRLAAHLGDDLSRFDRLLAAANLGPTPGERRAGRVDLHLLHALRIALVMQGLMIVARTPPFSRRHDMSREDLFERAFALQFREIANLLTDVFPDRARDIAALGGLQEQGEEDAGPHGYKAVHAKIIAPLREVADLLDDITLAVSHAYGAFG